jgi:hypothetical protein
MAALDAAIQSVDPDGDVFMDGRVKPGHDIERWRSTASLLRINALAAGNGGSRQPAERIPDIAGASRSDNIGSGPLSENLAAVQHDDGVRFRHLIDQMRGPQRAQALG